MIILIDEDFSAATDRLDELEEILVDTEYENISGRLLMILIIHLLITRKKNWKR